MEDKVYRVYCDNGTAEWKCSFKNLEDAKSYSGFQKQGGLVECQIVEEFWDPILGDFKK